MPMSCHVPVMPKTITSPATPQEWLERAEEKKELGRLRREEIYLKQEIRRLRGALEDVAKMAKFYAE
jgi:cell division protein FtsB